MHINVIYLHNPSLHLLGAAASVAPVARTNFANIEIIFAEDIHQLESELVDVLAIELEMNVHPKRFIIAKKAPTRVK